MHRDFIEKLEANPVIAAIKDDKGLEKAIKTECEIIFILYGDVCTIPGIVQRIKSADKIAMVHLDLITGLNNTKEISVDFIKNNTQADGIITTKGNLIGRAKELGLYTVLRYFVIDSMALVNIEKQDRHGISQPDVIEILPGIVLPKIIKRVNKASRVPVLAGGLIGDKDDVMNALNNGVLAVSTTNEEVWEL
ncbi:glycerol uptake operon antiterminator [Pseudobutyrivibrio sp. 49]|uniref:glycerol-3-phosphate responsive antiterminator n=1 Tax=unclassified Pseudobutyrivibrio TaxID=2638619 RepID=UPI000886A292|nr:MULTISPECIES: glycerol-3-phosphate responsive antiterminator [unclassified Pseudobutyrivibrio]SDI25963.1 glycerol uptake operon antiterminator [Pseudobutyrivibrio sp. 49]SFO12766.1 glycerol uptake operon antiterminator [Pseudobutyrivibrio sp. UC1225]